MKFMTFEKCKKTYQRALFLVLIILFLSLTYTRLKENDTYSKNTTEAGYLEEAENVSGDLVLAEEMEQVNFYAGTYELTICAKTDADNAAFQVIDLWTNTVLAEHEYTPGEEYHTVHFTTTKLYHDVVVRSILKGVGEEANYDGNPKDVVSIYGYTMNSDGTVCCDAKWEVLLLTVYIGAVMLGIRRIVRKRKPVPFLLLMLSSCVSLPFLSEHLPMSHDIYFHMSRICSLGMAIQNHQIPQRLTATLGGNSIVPIMYPEIMLSGAGFMVATGATVFLAYKVTCIFITFLTTFTAYGAVRSVTSEKAALIFTLLYVLNPFRMNELYLRAAIGEAFGMAFLPLVVVGMWQILHEKERRGAMFLLLGYTGLLSSHIVLTVISSFFCVIFVISELVLHPCRIVKRGRSIVWLAGTGVLCAGVNAWFLIPFLGFYGESFNISSDSSKGTIQYTSVYPWQIFMGGTAFGNDNWSNSPLGEMSLTIGSVLLIGVIAFIVMYSLDCTSKMLGAESRLLTEREQQWGKRCLFLGAAAIYISSSYFPWTYLNDTISFWCKTIGQVQFAWRFLTIAAMMLCVVTAIVVWSLLRSNIPYAKLLAGGMLLLAVVSGIQTATEYYSNPDYMNSKFDEYLYTNYDYMYAEELPSGEVYDWMKPESEGEDEVKITDYHSEGVNYCFSYEKDSETEGRVKVPVFWYGLHRAYLTETADDGSTETDATELAVEMDETTQFTVLTLPACSTRGEVRLVYEEPFSFRVGNWISIVTITVLAIAAAGNVCKRNRNGIRKEN